MKKLITIPQETIQQKIYYIRGEKVMFDKNLAELYGVETKVLNQAVKRSKKRFPSDFMFQLNNKEAEIFLRFQNGTSNRNEHKRSRSQIVTLKRGQNIKYLPRVFTEQGVAMLSSVLNSERAIQVNIQIMRTFTQIRKMLISHKDLQEKLDQMEKKYDKQFKIVFDTLRLLLKEDEKPKNKIGFNA
ncbi:MAG TPA: DNA-binding protein [Candidatus Moranbacteria bacterium]|nr:DNA-binding protein [Candidatus Moranbacteria bacterium]